MKVCIWVAHGKPEVCETCQCDKVEPLVPRCRLCGRDQDYHRGLCWKCYSNQDRDINAGTRVRETA